MGIHTRIENGKLKYVFPYVRDGVRFQPGFDDPETATVEAETHDDRVRRRQTLRAWIRHFISYKAPGEDTTYGRHIRTHLNLCLSLVGDVKLAATDADDIGRLYSALLNSDSIHCPQTAHNYIDTVYTCLKVAVSEGRLAYNPVAKWRTDPTNRRSRPAPKPDLPDPKARENILEKLPEFALLGISLIEEANMTSLEVAALRISDVDFERKVLRVTHTYNSNFNDIRPVLPNAKRTSQQLSDKLMEMLRTAIALSQSIGSEFVVNVLGPNGKPNARTLIPRKLRESLYATQAMAKIVSRKTEKPYKLEDFRDRGVAARLNASRANHIKIQAHAGYACHYSFSRRYGDLIKPPNSHSDMARAQAVGQALGNLLISQP